jgi:hypothetical protein
MLHALKNHPQKAINVASERHLKPIHYHITIYKLQFTDYKLQVTNLQAFLGQPPQSKCLLLFILEVHMYIAQIFGLLFQL